MVASYQAAKSANAIRERGALIAPPQEVHMTKCECEINHDKVGTHPAFHGEGCLYDSCQNFGTEVLKSDYGTFTLCPPCADDALSGGGYYRRQ